VDKRIAALFHFQWLGAGFLVLVVLAHVREALSLFPAMQRGSGQQPWSLP
jgi:hypothetical protein